MNTGLIHSPLGYSDVVIAEVYRQFSMGSVEVEHTRKVGGPPVANGNARIHDVQQTKFVRMRFDVFFKVAPPFSCANWTGELGEVIDR